MVIRQSTNMTTTATRKNTTSGWGCAQKRVLSTFFKGISIIDTAKHSYYGHFMNIVNKIFGSDAPTTYDLPKIIVIGAESSGKSSTIEAITKTPIFPRHSNRCTKAPIHLKLTNGIQKPIKITYKDKVIDGIQKPIKITYKDKVIEVNDKKEIEKNIQTIFASVDADTIIEDEIFVEITDKNMPNFEFFDLPGIVAYPDDLAKKSQEVTERYIKMDNSIIICIAPATTPRLTSYVPIALIKKHNKINDTILTLSMIDRIQPENIKELVVDRLLFDTNEFKDLTFADCVAIINRSHTDVVSLEKQEEKEIKWFEDNLLSVMPENYMQHETTIRDRITATNLIKNIDSFYQKYIKNSWKPRTINSINSDIEKVKNDIAVLGEIITNENVANVAQLIQAKINDIFVTEQNASSLCDKLRSFYSFPAAQSTNKLRATYEEEYNIEQFANSLNDHMFNLTFLIDIVVTSIESIFVANMDKYRLERFVKLKESLVNDARATYSRNMLNVLMKPRYNSGSWMLRYCHNKKYTVDAIVEIASSIMLKILAQSLNEVIVPSITNLFEEDITYRCKRTDLNKRLVALQTAIVELNTQIV